MSTSKTINTADPLNRILAALVDGTTWFILYVIISFPLGFALLATTASLVDASNISELSTLIAANQGISWVSSLIGLVIWVLLYLVVQIYVWRGQTLGKKLLGIKLVAEDQGVVSIKTILLRYSVYLGLMVLPLIPFIGTLSSCLFFIFLLVNAVMIFSDVNKQTLPDKMAKTYVVNA
jgi:uncharacterized RDD family membrane protein YckC